MPPQGALGGSGQLGTPQKKPAHCGAQPLPQVRTATASQVLELAASKVAHFPAFDHPGRQQRPFLPPNLGNADREKLLGEFMFYLCPAIPSSSARPCGPKLQRCPCSCPPPPAPSCPILSPPRPCHTTGLRWKALPEEEKAKYKVNLVPLPSRGPEGNHVRPPTSAPCLNPRLTTTAGAVPGQVLSAPLQVYRPHSATDPIPPAFRGSAAVVPVAAPAGLPAGFVWVAALADRRSRFSQEALAQPTSSTESDNGSTSSMYSSSFEDRTPAPGNTAAPRNTATWSAAPPTAPPAAPPTALPAAPLLLPAALAQVFGKPIGLDGALAALHAPSVAPAASSSSWLEQQELAEVLEEQLTGLEAIEVIRHTTSKYRQVRGSSCATPSTP